MDAAHRLFESCELPDVKECKWLGAASELPCVYGGRREHMRLLIVFLEKAFCRCSVVAHGACVWFVSCVGAHVSCEIAL